MGNSRRPSKLLILQERDLALLRGLFESRAMTAAHAAALYFNGRAEMTKKRLQRLKAEGLVTTRDRQPTERAVLHLGSKGLDRLRDTGILADYPTFDLPVLQKRAQVSRLTIDHELAVMDVKAAFHGSCRASSTYSLADFSTWPRLNQFEAGILVKPDGFVRIHENEADGGLSEHTFFVEVDRSSESLDTLVSRARAYVEYYKSGGFAEKHGAPRSAYREYPFRILFVLKTAERRNNLAEALLRGPNPIFTQTYLATQNDVTANPLGAVWIRPLDYQTAVRDTAFDIVAMRPTWEYRRQSAREAFIDKQVRKVSLLVDV